VTETAPRPFIVIGENIHATRVLLRSGARVGSLPDGSPALPFVDDEGVERLLPVPAAGLDGAGEREKVKHVKAAVLAGLAGGPDADLGRGYVRHLARRQAEAGAHYLDLNVDEVANDLATRTEAMRWLVAAVEDATPVALSLDSSAPEVMRAGLETATRAAGVPLLNSEPRSSGSTSSTSRPGRAAASSSAASARPGCPSRRRNGWPTGSGSWRRPPGADSPMGALHVDPLVLPVAVEPEVGAWFLEAVRTLRATFGPEIHLTGGLSNVSFGLPQRKLLNDVFIDLAADAGADSGIIDPVASDPRRIFAQDRGTRAYALATALLTGADPYGMEFLTAYRAGEVA
jgi:5-methyltetrahydrofolate--homocysteine methyltransferase